MEERHRARQEVYARRFEDGDAGAAIDAAVRAANAELGTCPEEMLSYGLGVEQH